MAKLEDLIMAAYEKQMRQYMDQMAKQVRVTMLEDFPAGSPRGHVCMRHGSTEAYVQPNGPDDDMEVNDMTSKPRRIVPGRPIHYHLSKEPILNYDCVCQDEPFDIDYTIQMPLVAAQLYFGNWTMFDQVQKPGKMPDVENSKEWQKKKVANAWGGYKKARLLKETYHGQAKNLPNIGPPDVPKVEIVRLDSTLRAIPNSKFVPWETYRFMDDVQAGYGYVAAPGGEIIFANMDEMEAMVERLLAKKGGLKKTVAA